VSKRIRVVRCIGNCEFGYNATGAVLYQRTIIKAPTGVCAVYQDSNYVKEFYYVHTDYQGSWLAITNSNKAVTNRYSYDAWGRPRNVNDWTLKSVGITSALTNLNSFQPRFDRGYTGHEIMAGFGLINMNGRLYDPYLQRFLSPDPYVQAPNNSQSYNRYSYCMNNPLMYTDPSGYSWLGDRWKWAQRNAVPIAGIAAITAAAVLTCGGASILLAGAIAGGIGGGLTTGLQGGSLGQIAKSAAIGGAIGGFCGVLGGAMIGSGASITATTAFTSTFGSGLSAMVSGSTAAPKVSLGGASVDLNNWKVRTMFGKGTNAADDIGYLFGGLGNLSDIVNLRASYKAQNRNDVVDQSQLDKYCDRQDGMFNNGKFGGADGTNSPEYRRCVDFEEPVGKTDWLTYDHDLTYYKNGADGLLDALFNTNVLTADKALVDGCRNLINYTTEATRWTSNINYVFTAIVGIKTISANSYLFTNYNQ